ncbi:MAG: sensor histidine kinase [Lawsonibacter sp.]|nr:sensor histidine kinase [Lawsonibacter sp.]
MLLIVLFLCVATSSFVAFKRRDQLSIYLLGMSLSNLLMLTGVIIYIAAMGGIAATEQVFLFLRPEVKTWFQYLPISMSMLGYLVTVGRTLFPYFLLLAGLEVTMLFPVRRRVRLLKRIALIPPALSLIFYYPKVFYTLVVGRLWLLKVAMPVSNIWTLLYIAAALTLVVQEYRATTIHFFKRSFRYVVLSVFSITALYLLYAAKEPTQIYNMFIGEYIRLGVNSYIDRFRSVLSWAALGLCTVFFVIVGSYGMVRYTQVNVDEDREDLTLQRKFDAAGMGVSVFVHGIKNQLLASRVAQKKLNRALAGESPNLEEVRRSAALLWELNEGMLARMDELYRTVKASALSLRPIHLDMIAASAVKRFHGKYPDAKVEVELGTNRLVLADYGPLGEALYNLLINGYEAAVLAGRTPEVKIITRAERFWTVVEIWDNGGGIPPELQSKIYDPFFTSKNTNYNWGMGLYYVRKIVKGHWGRLRLECRTGEGSSFFVMLPLFDAERGTSET